MTTETQCKLSVWAPATPGAASTMVFACDTLKEARGYATSRFARRGDLRGQDVEIRLGRDGKRIGFAGPSR